MRSILLFCILVMILCIPVFAEVPEYSVYRTTGKIVLDGIFDEEDWKEAPSAKEISTTSGPTGSTPRHSGSTE